MMLNALINLLILFFSEHADLPHPPYVYYVKPVASGTGSGLSWDNASSNLQAMINMVGDSLTSIWVARGTYQPDSGQSFVLNERKIYGGFSGYETNISQRNPAVNETILRGNHNRVIYNNDNGLTNATVLDGFTITAGAARLGAGIYNSNASPSIFNCKFLENNATDSGGAIYNYNNSSPLISQCIFRDNRSYKGIGIYNHNNCSPSIIDCNFIGPGIAQFSPGGAIVNRNNMPIITGCSFGGDMGSGIMNDSNCSATISNCWFSTVAKKPAIDNNGSPVSITNCTFSSNASGAIRNSYSNVTIKNCSFIGNRSTVIYNFFSSPAITNCLFSGNYTNTISVPGCLYNENSLPVVTNCTFAGNSSNERAILNINSNPSFFNCIIWGNNNGIRNTSSTCIVRYSIVQGGFTGTGNKNADPLFIDGPSYTQAPFTNGNFSLRAASPAHNAGNNSSVPAGVVTDLEGKPRIVDNIVDMGTYEYRVSPGPGNILYVNQNSGSKNRDGNSWVNAFTDLFYALEYAKANANRRVPPNTLKIFVAKATYLPVSRPENPSVKSNTTDRNNAFLVIPNVKLYGGFDPLNGIDSLNDTRIFGTGGTILSGNIGAVNDSSDNCYHVIVSSGEVGAALLDGFTITVGNANDTGTINVNGNAIDRSWGGGMNCYASSPTISNCTFLRNSGSVGGGLFNNISSPSISSCNFSNNSSYFGGAIFNHTGSAPTITGCNFLGNRANGYGGAVYNNSPASIVHYSHCNFSGNYTIDYERGGAGMFNNSSSPSISHCSFSNNNSSYYGGGIYNYLSSSPVIDTCTFTANTSAMFGGGIFNDPQASATITGSVFSGNYSQFGGGMLNSGPAKVTGCTFTNNSVASYGGGVYNLGAYIVSTYTNCIFSGNYTINYGGGGAGMFNNGTWVTLANCTFQGNNATMGAAIHNWFITITNIRNCLIWGNSSAIYNENTGLTSVQNSDVQGGYYGNLNVDPLFVNISLPPGPDGIWGTQDDGLRLQQCSPAINTGSNSLVAPDISTDISGASRIQYGVVDIGAFEAGTPPCGSLTVQTKAATMRTGSVNNETRLLMYPNPAMDRVYISNAAIGSSYSLFDNVGHKVMTGRISNALQEINLNGLARGVYYIDITSTGSVSKKLKLLKK